MENGNNFDYMERLAREYNKKLSNIEGNIYDGMAIILEEQLELVDCLFKSLQRKLSVLTALKSGKYEALRLTYKNAQNISEKQTHMLNNINVERIKDRLINLQLELFKFVDKLEGMDVGRIKVLEDRNLSLMVYL